MDLKSVERAADPKSGKLRTETIVDDVRAIATPVLRHRIITTFNAESSGISSDDVVSRLLEHILKGEEEGVDWLEAQLHIVGEIGKERYLAEMIS